jgi:hypothetical protein
METNPKKSKALIITVIILIIFLIAGYFLFIKKDKEGNRNTNLSRVFSSLVSSNNKKNTTEKNGVSEIRVVQAGENISKGDSVYVSGTNADNNPIIMKASGTNAIGFANQNIETGEMGEITIVSTGLNNFWNSISTFVGGIIGNGFGGGGNNGNSGCLNGATNPPLCTIGANQECLNGATNPPLCTMGGGGNNGGGDKTPPDLIAGEITPTNININIPTTLSSTITNQGETSTGHSFLTVFTIINKPSGPGGSINPEIKPTTTISGKLLPKATVADTSVKLTSETETLAGNNSTTSSVSYSFNTTGTYYIMACADSDTQINTEGGAETPNTTPTPTTNGSVTESNEGNNCGPWTTVTVTNLPDLKAGPVTPITATINTPTTIYSTISNNGSKSTEKSFTALFIISRTSGETINTNTNTVSKTTIKDKIVNLFSKVLSISRAIASGEIELRKTVPVLLGGKNNTINVLYTFKEAGAYYIRACADKTSSSNDNGSIVESNENNNCGLWTTVTVTNTLPTGGQFQCNDTLDNDSDGKIDTQDPNCHVDGDLTKEYIPTHDDESSSPTTKFQCNDTLDNDSDGKIDTQDPNCHVDGDLTKEYVSTHDSELNSPEGDGDENKCLLFEKNPLVFTDTEKAKLAELLRKYYLIAPTLKTEDDIYITYRELDSYENLIETVGELTNQCYEQTSLASYTGPKTRYGNPWYKGDDRGSYVPITIPDEKPHCEPRLGKPDIAENPRVSTRTRCSNQYTKMECENEFQIVDGVIIPTSGVQDNCQWVEKTSLKEYEAILNIW